MNLAYTPSTSCAVATAPGRGGVGVVRISGRAPLPLAQPLSGGKTPAALHHLYRFVAADGTPIDNGLLLYFPARTVLPANVIELGHGVRWC
jgi:tRNA modification GTPase